MKSDRSVWQLFVASAIALAVIAGFGLGGGLLPLSGFIGIGTLCAFALNIGAFRQWTQRD